MCFCLTAQWCCEGHTIIIISLLAQVAKTQTLWKTYRFIQWMSGTTKIWTWLSDCRTCKLSSLIPPYPCLLMTLHLYPPGSFGCTPVLLRLRPSCLSTPESSLCSHSSWLTRLPEGMVLILCKTWAQSNRPVNSGRGWLRKSKVEHLGWHFLHQTLQQSEQEGNESGVGGHHCFLHWHSGEAQLWAVPNICTSYQQTGKATESPNRLFGYRF